MQDELHAQRTYTHFDLPTFFSVPSAPMFSKDLQFAFHSNGEVQLHNVPSPTVGIRLSKAKQLDLGVQCVRICSRTLLLDFCRDKMGVIRCRSSSYICYVTASLN